MNDFMPLKTFNIFVIGCQMNRADSERIQSYLTSFGLVEVANPEMADLLILVTCGVRQSAEDRIFGLLPRWRRARPELKVVLTGCLALRADVREKLAGQIDVWLPIFNLPGLGADLGLTDPAPSNGYDSLSYLTIEPHYDSAVNAFLPIGTGCNNFCSYCVVPYARGREVYRPHGEIVEEAMKLVKRGYKEITLIAQNVNSYSSLTEAGGQLDFADLFQMVDAIPGDWWLRFSTSHPKDMSDRLIETVAAGRHACQYFHFALQSGNDEILKRMNRRYTAAHYLELVKKIRAVSPEAMISTDVIVGYPGETLEQFADTARVMEEARFDMAYLACFSPRPGTVAAREIDNVLKAEKERRESVLNEILKKTANANNQKFLGRTVRVLVDLLKTDKTGRRIGGGKTADFKTVRFTADKKMAPGQWAEIVIDGVLDFGFTGHQAK